MPYERILDTMARLCPDVIAAVRGYVAAWHTRFQQDGRGIPRNGRGAARA
jgi:hypothetical protein